MMQYFGCGCAHTSHTWFMPPFGDGYDGRHALSHLFKASFPPSHHQCNKGPRHFRSTRPTITRHGHVTMHYHALQQGDRERNLLMLEHATITTTVSTEFAPKPTKLVDTACYIPWMALFECPTYYIAISSHTKGDVCKFGAEWGPWLRIWAWMAQFLITHCFCIMKSLMATATSRHHRV